MKSRWKAAAVAVALTGVVAGGVQAQTNEKHFGPHLVYNFDLKKFGIGAQFSVPVANHVEFYPSFDYYFVDGSVWALNADIKYRFAGQGLDWLYAGGGLNLFNVAKTNVNLNLIAGVESLKGRVHPFGEFRAILGSGSSVQLAAGLNITLGMHRR